MKMKRYVALAVLAMSCMALCAGQWPGGFGDAHMARVRHWEGVDNVRDLGDIVTDYAMTSLSTSGIRRPDACTRQFRTFDKYHGATLNERVEAYVLDCGFTRDDIAKFRGIMLER